MRILLIIEALIESGAGLAIMILPSLAARILLGEALESPAALVIARVAGVALLSLGVACGLSSRDGRSRPAAGMVTAMLLYNIGAVAILTYAGIGDGLYGIALWPAVVVHIAMAIWCGMWIQSVWRDREVVSVQINNR